MVTGVSNSPTAANAATSKDTSSLAGNYTTFLNLLTAQIKNQDPLSPMDTTQWTNQLVQYSSVEQQIKSNGYLATLASQNSQGNMNAAVGYIGKTVVADQDQAMLKDGSASWQYALGASANTVGLTISDSDGNVVWKGNADSSQLASGVHDFSWDGKNTAGQAVKDGVYTLSVTATNTAGTVDAAVGIKGVVNSAANADGTILLKIGNTSVPLTSITSVS
ncbi:hypothetical protein AEAC466_02150 [Asticcacaulis sp. AC466]|uniref:flagellar hook assembly protein FlgD n=1 Tax=Asticcacaulis sp. AC466 TaxID=1282362 RepID=UPI0003C4036E|nr:flagellar hook assembly protein FlgD [Asticcacaulis sp. AC466]ESQ86009.1 hypothetical protein AEAC466_02150 [Asticcacaulis sp. AC466]